MDNKDSFLDYNLGWVGRCHDWVLFQKFDIGKIVIKIELLPNKLIGVVYLIRSWFYSPFKGERNALPRIRHIGVLSNHQQRMAVERAFGILQKILKCLLKRIDMPLWHYLVITCICLHNLCIMHQDKFDDEWTKQRENIMHRKIKNQLGQL